MPQDELRTLLQGLEVDMVRETSGRAGDSREGAGRSATGKVVLYFLLSYSLKRRVLVLQCLQQRVCLLEVGGVKALGEPAIDLCQ